MFDRTFMVARFRVSNAIDHDYYVFQRTKAGPLEGMDAVISAAPIEGGEVLAVVEISERLAAAGIDAERICREISTVLGGRDRPYVRSPLLAWCRGPKGWKILEALEGANGLIEGLQDHSSP